MQLKHTEAIYLYHEAPKAPLYRQCRDIESLAPKPKGPRASEVLENTPR